MKRLVIAIAGGSGSGKTLLAETLAEKLKEVTLLGLDAFYRDQSALTHEERTKVNYDDPATIDFEEYCNVLKQLKEDVEFGYEKAVNERGISSSLMYMVVLDWCKVLDNEFSNWTANDYGDYGKPLFIAVANKYGWTLPSEQEIKEKAKKEKK